MHWAWWRPIHFLWKLLIQRTQWKCFSGFHGPLRFRVIEHAQYMHVRDFLCRTSCGLQHTSTTWNLMKRLVSSLFYWIDVCECASRDPAVLCVATTPTWPHSPAMFLVIICHFAHIHICLPASSSPELHVLGQRWGTQTESMNSIWRVSVVQDAWGWLCPSLLITSSALLPWLRRGWGSYL